MGKIHDTFTKHRGSEAHALIRDLNMKIRGWANYHKDVVSAKTFSYVDGYIWNEAWQWVKRRTGQRAQNRGGSQRLSKTKTATPEPTNSSKRTAYISNGTSKSKAMQILLTRNINNTSGQDG
ncbi:group II intron maturase-specific domain-containing protein [uncultured Desulfobacter sp.]|uniref:group II intron maturase-specific domain-containing protein n=1 Tax=uncultured Desulfobacter sp. TaxID=240139 RepID=UPI0029F55D72|nr:group II intron maturase-specific domain-containing protein [uncultured Desulfobacter sp.]